MSNFYEDVIRKSPSFNSIKRVSSLDLLEPVTRQKVLEIIDDAKAHGIELMVFETYRSPKRQEELFRQGATKLQKVGVHHYGLACDVVKSIKGDPSWKGDFSLFGQLAHEHGLIWGGDWGNPAVPHTFIDEVHVQRCTLARQASLFKEEWYPGDSYNPYA